MANYSYILATRAPWTVWKAKNIWNQKISPTPRSEDVQYAPGGEQKAINDSSRKNEEAGPKQKGCSDVELSGSENEVWCCKEHHCKKYGMLGPWISVNWTWSSRKWASLVAQVVSSLSAMQEAWNLSLGRKDLLEKEVETNPSIPAWRIPWTKEPCRLHYIGSQDLDMTWQLNHHQTGDGKTKHWYLRNQWIEMDRAE